MKINTLGGHLDMKIVADSFHILAVINEGWIKSLAKQKSKVGDKNWGGA
jgi:hypothetical protein